MAPEMWRGQTATVQSDLYALGIILFEVLSGRLPFTSGTSASLMYQHMESDIPPLDIGVTRTLPGIELLYQSLLSKDQEKRPASATAVLAEIEQLLPENLTADQLQLSNGLIAARVIPVHPKIRAINHVTLASIFIALMSIIALLYVSTAASPSKKETVQASNTKGAVQDNNTTISTAPELLKDSLLWLSASSIEQSSTAPLPRWVSMSSSEISFEQESPDRRPTVTRNQGSSLQAIKFDGRSQFLESPSLAKEVQSLDEMTLIFAASANLNRFQQFIWSAHLNDSSAMLIRVGFGKNSRLKLNLSSEPQTFDFESDPIPNVHTPNIYSVTCGRGSCSAFLNSRKILTAPIRTPLRYRDVTSVFIGQELDGRKNSASLRYTDFFNGKILEIAFLDRRLTPTQREEIERFFATRNEIELQ
jgi:hypothetical protein